MAYFYSIGDGSGAAPPLPGSISFAAAELVVILAIAYFWHEKYDGMQPKSPPIAATQAG